MHVWLRYELGSVGKHAMKFRRHMQKRMRNLIMRFMKKGLGCPEITEIFKSVNFLTLRKIYLSRISECAINIKQTYYLLRHSKLVLFVQLI